MQENCQLFFNDQLPGVGLDGRPQLEYPSFPCYHTSGIRGPGVDIFALEGLRFILQTSGDRATETTLSRARIPPGHSPPAVQALGQDALSGQFQPPAGTTLAKVGIDVTPSS